MVVRWAVCHCWGVGVGVGVGVHPVVDVQGAVVEHLHLMSCLLGSHFSDEMRWVMGEDFVGWDGL